MRKRPTRRSSRYRIDAFASGGRPSQARPSTAPPRPAASASGETRPGGGRRRPLSGDGSGPVISSHGRARSLVRGRRRRRPILGRIVLGRVAVVVEVVVLHAVGAELVAAFVVGFLVGFVGFVAVVV